MQNVALFLIWLYQKAVSPYLRPSCRYYPSCSTYAYGAVQKHGVLTGSFLAFKRILRCHPLHRGGYDPVPDAIKKDF
ncbi:MAG: membrane protein insertion efficiency factor YidD [Treponema sp.]|nr:membrane protein insertion efficiency factor YidD [Treponema sp.]